MNNWLFAALGLVPPLLAGVIAAGRSSVPLRLIAIEFTASLSIFMLIVLSFAFDQPSSIDLALTLAILTLPGTLLFTLWGERWL